jgi:hypothetical protein
VDDWLAKAAAALGVTDPVDVTLVLDLAREVAHGVTRPAAPVTSYLLGLAVARGLDPVEAAERITALARAWPTEAPPQR